MFYTPADVATFMAAQAMRELEDDALPLTVFDPACGTGVFVRAVLSERHRVGTVDRFDFACSALYGCDIDEWAAEATAFVLFCECYPDIRERNIPPLAAWHAIRLNFATIDALLLDPADDSLDLERDERLKIRSRLKAGEIVPETGTARPLDAVPLNWLFPELGDGPRVVLGNPPYADLGSRSDLTSLSRRFETLGQVARQTADVYPLFVEQMVRLTAPNAHGGAMVLPLSFAYSSRPQFVALRSLLAKSAGKWSFAFFDREPHALFGEDVKTRNAIVIWSRPSNRSSVEFHTGPLRKWRGHSRAQMFTNIGFTPIESDIRGGIPKIGTSAEANALARVSTELRTLATAVRFGRAVLEQSFTSDEREVHVGATAYNFLNVFLRPPKVVGVLTEHPLHSLVCADQVHARQVFALLHSSMAYWWWHIHGDGFHVSQHGLATLPIGSALTEAKYSDSLYKLGAELWTAIASSPVVSVNRGRTSLGFSSLPQRRIRAHIDSVVIAALGLQGSFAGTLERFVDAATSASLGTTTNEKGWISE